MWKTTKAIINPTHENVHKQMISRNNFTSTLRKPPNAISSKGTTEPTQIHKQNGYKYDFGRFQLFFLWIRVGLGLRRSLVSYSIYMLSNPTELGS